MKSLAIITPTLNADQYLESCILSAKKLIFNNSNISHVIVDSGSKDNTLAIADKYNIKVLYYPPGNMYAAINFGINNTSSDLVTYINADDELSGNILNTLRTNADIDLFIGELKIINTENKDKYIWKPLPKILFYSSYISCGMPFAQSGTVFSRKLLKNLGNFDTNYQFASDYDLFCRAFLSRIRYKKIDKCLALIRLHNSQLSKINRKFHEQEISYIRNNLFKSRRYELLNLILYRIFSFMYRQPFVRLINYVKFNVINFAKYIKSLI